MKFEKLFLFVVLIAKPRILMLAVALVDMIIIDITELLAQGSFVNNGCNGGTTKYTAIPDTQFKSHRSADYCKTILHTCR